MTHSVLILTDVFGNTPAVSSLSRHLEKPCAILSPFESTLTFQSEQDAYHAFLASGGVAAYAKKILRYRQTQGQKIHHVIGFSVGASAWWMQSAANLDQAIYDHIVSACLFYGSRIREYMHIKPKCATQLVFAEQESAYQPEQLVQQFREHGHQAEIARGTRHGFMNPYAAGFSLKTQTHYLNSLRQQVHGKHIPS